MQSDKELSNKEFVSNTDIERKILKMNSPQLSDYLNTLMLENPVLEIEENSSGYTDEDLELRKSMWLESNDFEEGLGYFDKEIKMPEKTVEDYPDHIELSDFLKSQLIEVKISETIKSVAGHVINALDENGYLLATIEDIMSIAECSKETALEAISTVQNLEPIGVGASSLEECLCLQLDEQDNLARNLIKNYISDVGEKRVSLLASELGVDKKEISLAVERILMLNPKPGTPYSHHERSIYITPDVVMIKFPDEYYVALNEFSYPNIRISEEYQNLLKYTDDMEAKKYIQEKIDDSIWVGKCVEKRNKLLLEVSKAIVKKQELFFRYGPKYLKLIRIDDICEHTGLEKDIVKRVLKNKYLQSPLGVYPLKFFVEKDKIDYNVGMSHVRERLQELIAMENTEDPYTDEKIMQLLELEGISLNEDIIERYREEMGIPDYENRIFYHEEEHSCECDCGHVSE